MLWGGAAYRQLMTGLPEFKKPFQSSKIFSIARIYLHMSCFSEILQWVWGVECAPGKHSPHHHSATTTLYHTHQRECLDRLMLSVANSDHSIRMKPGFIWPAQLLNSLVLMSLCPVEMLFPFSAEETFCLCPISKSYKWYLLRWHSQFYFRHFRFA